MREEYAIATQQIPVHPKVTTRVKRLYTDLHISAYPDMIRTSLKTALEATDETVDPHVPLDSGVVAP